jgi:hypothetical protein
MYSLIQMMFNIFLSSLLCFNVNCGQNKVSKEILAVVNATHKSGKLVPHEIADNKFVSADFTADQCDERIIFVRNSLSKKIGVLVWQPLTEGYKIFGAGNVYDQDLLLDNLHWVSRFEIVPPGIYPSGDKHRAELRINFHALRIAGNTMGSALIYFDGMGFNYFYQVSPLEKIQE